MPSKFVAKSFAREEIAQSADRIRRDVVALIERSLPEFKDTYSIDNYSQKINHLLELKEKVNGISSELNMHCKKISRLVEGSIRRVISLQKSEPWVRSITVDSAADIVTFFQTSLKETQAWHDRSLTMVTDFLRDPGTVTRLVVLISGVISLSDDDKWGGLRELVAQYPWYKLVRVRISDGTRSDWDQSPYDEASYYVEHEPLHRGIARFDLPRLPICLLQFS
ncbi:hypothetical protein FN846DRAFT_982338 [Sphaerosporella brunnea]|uniref:Uncharacterized protein n=1 Tax=Sphaerosporella brunnea TaxID=1250544 RepID=A0A5J5EB88_9PEZI|nr:hypothetical protein FN846DRAFT_982338 [Sphaerosporella brunnea]